MRTICFISDGRTSHGIYKPILDEIKLNKNLNYKYILTGFHYGKKYGDTYKFVILEGYKIAHQITLKINSNIEKKQLLIIEYYISEIRKFLTTNKVDIFLGQGDRIVTLAAAIVCGYLKIPFAHMHGGEISGTFDETIRHTITKLSDIHFTASEDSYLRVLKLGEDRNKVFLTGSTSAEYIIKQKKNNLKNILSKYKIDSNFFNYCILLFNPDNIRGNKNKKDVQTIIKCLDKKKINTLMIYPNNDPYSDEIIQELLNIKNKRFILIKNFQFDEYITILKNSKFLIGNSSGGIIETPSLNIPNILVGERQLGRETAINTVHVKINTKEILNAIDHVTSNKFKIKISKKLKSPYLPLKNKLPSDKIINILEKINLKNIKEKRLSF